MMALIVNLKYAVEGAVFWSTQYVCFKSSTDLLLPFITAVTQKPSHLFRSIHSVNSTGSKFNGT